MSRLGIPHHLTVLAMMTAAAIAGCGGSAEMSAANKPRSLYERLGGEPAITAVVADFVGRAAANPRVNFTRKGTPAEWQATPENVAHLQKMLVQMICSVTGGPQVYEGRSMKGIHAGMQITNAEFDALAGDLKATLDQFKVPAAEQDELIKIVSTTRGDVVTAS